MDIGTVSAGVIIPNDSHCPIIVQVETLLCSGATDYALRRNLLCLSKLWPLAHLITGLIKAPFALLVLGELGCRLESEKCELFARR